MEFYLQFGWGMMSLARELIAKWGGGTAILSPRDLKPNQIERIGQDLVDLSGEVLIDPQFYLPRADHHRLISHEYWPQDYDTQGFSDQNRELMLRSLISLNNQAGSTSILVPGERADMVNELWLESQRALLETASDNTDFPLIATICLSSEAIRSNEQISLVIQQANNNTADGYYLVLEHPGYLYLVDDSQWLANTLDLATSLRRLGADVIVGYANQQQQIMACTGATAIASGTWMNVRSFFPDKFKSSYEENIKRRAIWYYCPQVLSEYRLPYLDIGILRENLLDELIPDPNTDYADLLFSAPQPSASGWSEPIAFRHYLSALHIQTQSAVFPTFSETLEYHREVLVKAEEIINRFRKLGIRGEHRDFVNSIEAHRSSLSVLENTHGPILRRRWGELTG